MGGALVVTGIGYRAVWRRTQPLFGGTFQVPNATNIDPKLVGGSALFGIGWGIAGFCPGAAIPALWNRALGSGSVHRCGGCRTCPATPDDTDDDSRLCPNKAVPSPPAPETKEIDNDVPCKHEHHP
jgi:hypothetical protein